jgi:hypothetical protein
MQIASHILKRPPSKLWKEGLNSFYYQAEKEKVVRSSWVVSKWLSMNGNVACRNVFNRTNVAGGKGI